MKRLFSSIAQSLGRSSRNAGLARHRRRSRPGPPPPPAPSAIAEAMATAASRWLDSLDDGQRQQAAPGFPGEPERSRWFYTPTDHGGLTLTGCTPLQRQAALRPPAPGVSSSRDALAAPLLGHEPDLEAPEGRLVFPCGGRGPGPPLHSGAR